MEKHDLLERLTFIKQRISALETQLAEQRRLEMATLDSSAQGLVKEKMCLLAQEAAQKYDEMARILDALDKASLDETAVSALNVQFALDT